MIIHDCTWLYMIIYDYIIIYTYIIIYIMILVFLWVFSRSNYSRELVHALWRAGLPRLRRREIGALFRHPKRGQIWLWINTYKNTIFSGMNIHKSQLFWGSLGTRVLTHSHISQSAGQHCMIWVWNNTYRYHF